VVASGENWSFRFDGFTGIGVTGGYGSAVPLAALEGSFNSSVDAVSAVMQPFGRCLSGDTNRVRFSGTRSSGGVVQLESLEQSGQVVRINATLSATGDALQGTYTITGGCGAGTAGAVAGRRVNLTGVWTGTMGAVPTVVNLQMASTPDADGNYALSGAVTFSNTPCFVNAVVTRRTRGRVMFPDIETPTQRLELIAEVSEDLTTMQIAYVLVTGTCPELSSGAGRLVRP
jgi:hypothetical protein